MFYISSLGIWWIYCHDHEFLKGNNSVTCQINHLYGRHFMYKSKIQEG